jgi:hypothetical protein
VYVREYVTKSLNKAVDFRVYLIPNKINTLAHYVAMRDDLYCNSIYLAFLQNPLFSLIKKSMPMDKQL